ncbi:GNAT family N-acetyltransferase [Kitasatospora sp. NBC_01287]|uniref:GNAT family N-acetyltransferase n=1 Tax=Kitasatospora sp. NBC_01287 TaxID=2903573 RepID=UPI002256BEC9|nr:GNAT family N-acetyltransferase [Kitasatospora sp. NBC_01287]MCX4751497.1 GNAT family N-acetyltransferase [Kitasatospora sp. NBC_01287]
MTTDDLLHRAERLWLDLAKAPAGVTVPAVLVSPDSGLCPPGWVGVVLLGGGALITAPDEAAAERIRTALAAGVDPLALGTELAAARVLGPAALAYLAPGDLRPVDGSGWTVTELSPDHPAVQALIARVSEEDAAECGLDEITSPAFAVLDEAGRVIAATGYRTWPGRAAHLCVLTDTAHRSGGLAGATATAATAHALAAGLLPQWRARVSASRRVAERLGFRELGTQLSIQLAEAPADTPAGV